MKIVPGNVFEKRLALFVHGIYASCQIHLSTAHCNKPRDRDTRGLNSAVHASNNVREYGPISIVEYEICRMTLSLQNVMPCK